MNWCDLSITRWNLLFHTWMHVKVHLFVWPTCLFAFLSFIVRNHKYNVNHHNETITKLRRNNTFETKGLRQEEFVLWCWTDFVSEERLSAQGSMHLILFKRDSTLGSIAIEVYLYRFAWRKSTNSPAVLRPNLPTKNIVVNVNAQTYRLISSI